jgi:hypothetical protein
MRTLMLLSIVAALAAATAVTSAGAAGPSYCSPSGDVCVGINHRGKLVFLQITTVAKYFPSYKLCVTGPRSRVCHVFVIRKSGSEYGSVVRWQGGFPNQGPGLYRVKWDAAAKVLTFRR